MASSGWLMQLRCFSTTNCLKGKRNFRKFQFINRRGSKEYRMQLKENNLYDYRGVRHDYVQYGNQKVFVPELLPELIVPDLTDCKFKPYVSYRAADIEQSEFTAKDLFNVIYAPKILDDFNSGKLDEEGNPLEPSENEKLTSEEARLRARQTGSDIFTFKEQEE